MDTKEYFNGTELIVQRANGSSLAVNLDKLVRAEQRCDEVESVTPTKAPELMAFLNRSCRETHQLSLMILKEKQRAERAAKRIKSRIVLDEAGAILKAKGLTSTRSPEGSKELRDAVLDGNDEYQTAMEKVEYLDGVYELINGKLDSFERAFYAVKSLQGQRQPGNGRFGGGNDDDHQELGKEDRNASWRDIPNPTHPNAPRPAARPAQPAGPPGSVRSQFGKR